MNPSLIILSNLTGQQFYVVLLNGTGQFWNTVAVAFENFNAAHWALYAISLQEIGQTGLYTAAYPAPVAALNLVTTEAIYQQRGAQPTIPLDQPPVYSGNTQGVNVLAINNSVVDAIRLALGNGTIVVGAAVAGTLTTTQMSSNVVNALNGAYVGRTILWTSGALAGSAAGVAAYDGIGGFIFSTMPVAPGAGDSFIIV